MLATKLVWIQQKLQLMVEYVVAISLCVHLLPAYQFSAVGPEIVLDPVPINVTIMEDDITLTCSSTGFPVPTIFWHHNDFAVTPLERVFFSNMSSYYQINSTLTIRTAMFNDTGTYSCTATSSIASYSPVNSAVVLVLVQS